MKHFRDAHDSPAVVMAYHLNMGLNSLPTPPIAQNTVYVLALPSRHYRELEVYNPLLAC